jgi:surface carbohydrate biosynthesis protein
MYKKTIYIPIEIKKRELSSQIMLALYAIKSENFRIYIGSKASINNILLNKKKKGGCYLYKGCHDDKYMHFIKKKCNLILILDQELSPNIEDYESVLKLRVHPDSIPYIDRYFVFSESVLNSISVVFPRLYAKTRVTGWPRLESWKKKYKTLYEADVRKINSEYGDYILFASDFGFLSDQCLDKVLKQESKLIDARSDLKSIDSLQKSISEKYLKELKGVIVFLKQLSSNESMPEIIIRPHPSESILKWKEIFFNYKRITVIDKGDIHPWILGSECLLHRGSTTSIQAVLSGVPSYYIAPNVEIIRKNVGFKVSTLIQNVNSFESKYLNRHLFFNKSHQDKIEELLNTNINPFSEILKNIPLKVIDSEPVFTVSIKSKLELTVKSFVSKVLNIRKNIKPDAQKLETGILSVEVSGILQSLMNIDDFDDFDEFQVMQVQHDLVVIEKN